MIDTISDKKNFDLAGRIFSAIWNRTPLIISSRLREHREKLLTELAYFIPAYRKLVIGGEPPKKILFGSQRPSVLSKIDTHILKETVFQLYEEETINNSPIQFIYCDADKEIFNDLLKYLPCGWIATTHFTHPTVLSHFISDDSITYKYEDSSIIQLGVNNSQPELEWLILKKSINRSTQALSYVLQKKMNEVRQIGQALIKEIEQDLRITYPEVLEEFEIQNLTFNKVLEIVRKECKIDIEPYIEMPPVEVTKSLKSLKLISWIDSAGVVNNDKLIGLARYRSLNSLPSIVFPTVCKIAESDHMGKLTIAEIEFDKKQFVVIKSKKYFYCLLLIEEFKKNKSKLSKLQKLFIEESNDSNK